jgi:hypothetical protein
MTSKSSPITPPPELVEQLVAEACPECRLTYDEFTGESVQSFATRAAQWGADQELEACCEWLAIHFAGLEQILRAARRPKPATLNSIALQMLGTIEQSEHFIPEITDTIRRALEALPND